MSEQQFSYAVWITFKAKPQDVGRYKIHAEWHTLNFTIPLREKQRVEIAGYQRKVTDLILRPTIYDPDVDDRWSNTRSGNTCTVDLGKIVHDSYEEVQKNIQRLERWRYENKE